MDDYTYGGIIPNISKEFDLALERMSAEYNFDLGDEFEVALCALLQRVLPSKYGICRGFVVDKSGNAAGDDIIIYDRLSFPDLRFTDRKDDFSRKGKIPVDAVYAYIEAKHTLTPDSLSKALDQVSRVKRLCYTRQPRLTTQADHHLNPMGHNEIHLFDNDYSRANGWDPIITNPVYGMVLSRHCWSMSNQRATTGIAARDFVVDQLNGDHCKKIEYLGFHCPDAIIAGNLCTGLCGHYRIDENGSRLPGIHITRFYTGLKPYACYQVNDHEESAFGLAIAHLLYALNYIQLGDMPWGNILNTAKIPDRELRDGFLHDMF